MVSCGNIVDTSVDELGHRSVMLPVKDKIFIGLLPTNSSYVNKELRLDLIHVCLHTTLKS